MQETPVPDPSRSHDVSGLTDTELARTRRDLQASLALARPGSAASVPISAHVSAIDAELAAAGSARVGSRPALAPGNRPAHLIRAPRSATRGRPG
jgi:hypothetical protein